MKDTSNKTVEEQDELVGIWDDVEVVDEVDDNLTLEEETEDTDEEVEESTEETDEEESEESEEAEGSTPPEETDEEVPLVKSIQNILGYELEGEFEDTEEGIAQMFEAARNKAADESLNTLLEQYPEAKELIEYRQMGGDPNKFFKTKFPDVDYQTIEFKEEDERQHEMLIRNELSARGLNKEEIEADIEDFKNGGILESKAKRALSTLKVKQQEDKENLIEQQREQHEQQKKQVGEFWSGVKETINNSTTFKSFSVPSKDKEEFFKYISKPVEDGKSKRDIDVENADLETRLAIDYLLYKGFNISDVVERKAKNLNAKTLRQKLKGTKLDKKVEDRSPEYTEELGVI
jgi:hypothetical protein